VTAPFSPHPRSTLSRRRALQGATCAALVAAVWRPSLALAGGVAVPIPMQVKLLAKVAKYDRNLAARAGGTAKVLVLEAGGNGESLDASKRMQSELTTLGQVAGLPVSVAAGKFDSAGGVVSKVKAEKIAIVCLTPGLSSAAGSLAKAFAGMSVLTVSTVPDFVRGGAVLGFDLVQGKPKVLVNLAQAKAQSVSLHPELLKIAEIVG